MSATMLDRVPIAIVLAIAGFAVGWLSAWCSEWLQPPDERTATRWGPVLKDPLVQIGSAAAWAVTPFLLQEPWWRWIEAGLVAVPLIQVAVTDLRTRYVYSV